MYIYSEDVYTLLLNAIVNKEMVKTFDQIQSIGLFNPWSANRKKVVCFSRLLKYLRSLYDKLCGPRSPLCLLLYLIRR